MLTPPGCRARVQGQGAGWGSGREESVRGRPQPLDVVGRGVQLAPVNAAEQCDTRCLLDSPQPTEQEAQSRGEDCSVDRGVTVDASEEGGG